MLTGEAPHRGQRDSDAFERARAGVIDPPELRAPTRDLPIVLCEIATDALAAKPDKRPANVQALIERLEGYLSGADKCSKRASWCAPLPIASGVMRPTMIWQNR